jgi:hypothetical protein
VLETDHCGGGDTKDKRSWFIDFFKSDLRRRVCQTSKSDLSSTKVTKFVVMCVMNLIAPKAGAKHKLLFNKLISEYGFVEHLSLT